MGRRAAEAVRRNPRRSAALRNQARTAGSMYPIAAAPLRIVAGWSFDEHVQPLFPVPACVLIARRETPAGLPATISRCAGHLLRRDATPEDAARHLHWRDDAWPPEPTLRGASPYRARFKQGATIVPRRFFIVEREDVGRLGQNAAAPVMRGRTGGQDKAPWRDVEPPRGPVEARFVRPVVLGETIAPFRLLEPVLGVIPVAGKEIMDAEAAALNGYRPLAAWLRDVEAKWRQHAAKRTDDSLRMTLSQRIDHMRGLTAQLGIKGPRLVYAASGLLTSAAILGDETAIVEHKAYWTPVRSVTEGQYLSAVLNAEAIRRRIAPMQSRGQGGARDFDNLMWELPIPEFDRRDKLHADIAAAAVEAERVAKAVELPERAYFTRKRRAIRDALAADGIAATIDNLVERLLTA